MYSMERQMFCNLAGSLGRTLGLQKLSALVVLKTANRNKHGRRFVESLMTRFSL